MLIWIPSILRGWINQEQMKSEDLIAQNKNEGHVVCMDDMRNAHQIFLYLKKQTNEGNDN